MVTELDTAALRRLLDDGGCAVQLLEVLPRGDYDEEHLAGAVHLALDDLTADGVAGLDPSAPTIVYGFDSECDRSPRAAARLEALGFTDVCDYAPGKAAWLAEGLPAKGHRRPGQRVASIADAGVPTVRGDATVGDLVVALADDDDDVAIVLDPDDVVLGVVRREVLGLDPATPVADVLQPGPSTFRPSMTIEELVEYFRSSEETRAIVSTLGGRWIGLIRREDVLDG